MIHQNQSTDNINANGNNSAVNFERGHHCLREFVGKLETQKSAICPPHIRQMLAHKVDDMTRIALDGEFDACFHIERDPLHQLQKHTQVARRTCCGCIVRAHDVVVQCDDQLKPIPCVGLLEHSLKEHMALVNEICDAASNRGQHQFSSQAHFGDSIGVGCISSSFVDFRAPFDRNDA